MYLENPYAVPGEWFRGNLHAHTTESDGRREPQAVIDDYAERQYDFLMISDHDMVTDVDAYDAAGMTLIYGNEVTANGPHLLHVNASRRLEPVADRQRVLAEIGEDAGAFAVLAHPNWRNEFRHYPQELLESLDGHLGIEIYNGVIERLTGSPYALDRWDMLLGGGMKVWGFAHDDSHKDGDVELGWNVVIASDRTVESLLQGFRRGSFYTSTGVTLTRLDVERATIEASADQPVQWELIGDFGRRLEWSRGESATFEVPDGYRGKYVRVQARGAFGRAAWTQPFFTVND